jgi:hypothetical protein
MERGVADFAASRVLFLGLSIVGFCSSFAATRTCFLDFCFFLLSSLNHRPHSFDAPPEKNAPKKNNCNTWTCEEDGNKKVF